MSGDPNQELVDIIDETGRTVGTVTRQQVRRERLPHRCVYVLVFNGRGELFIHLRTDSKDVYPAHWDVAVGGVLAAGESFLAGACREVGEELGVEAEPETLFPFRYADQSNTAQAMVYRLQHDGPFRLQPEEIVRGEFVPLSEIASRTARALFCPDGLAVLAEYRRQLTKESSP
jgi:isopentenyldiphosphate isomerase